MNINGFAYLEENGEKSGLQVWISLQFQTFFKTTLYIFKLLSSLRRSINTELLRFIEWIFCYKIFFGSSVGEQTVTVGSFCSCNHKDSLYLVAADLDIIEIFRY